MEEISDQEEIPLYLAVPELFPDRPNPAHNAFIEHLCIQSGVQINEKDSMVFPKGRAAGLIAASQAVEDILSGAHKYILVGGIDTYLDLYLLGTLDLEGRILGARVMDGFIPGEGAGFVLLADQAAAETDGLSSMAELSRGAAGFEEGHLYSEEPYKGEGLGTTFGQFFEENKLSQPIKDVYSSMNGENHWAKEWGVALLRNNQFFHENHTMHHPAEFYGDPGAASGILMVILASFAINNEYQAGPSLISCSSDFGDRATVAITSC